MRKTITKAGIFCAMALSLAGTANAQNMSMDNHPMGDTVTEFKPHGNLWGYTFGDYAFKGATDNLNRGGANQYTGMQASASQFQFRRIYLGYNFDISPKFSSEILLAAEDDFSANNPTGTPTSLSNPTSVGDILANGKFSPYIKYANIRWKNIFKNSDLVIGEQATPGFAKTGRNDQSSEEVWGYRSLERTVSDIRRTPSYDMGVSLQGWFDNKGCFGYTAMVANGSSAKPENDPYKWFYGSVYAKFFKKRLVIDLYQDYERLAMGVFVKGTNGPEYSDRNMTKLFVAWNTNKLTIGFEAFQNTILSGIKVVGADKNNYYRTDRSMAMSFYVRGRILSAPNGDPRLNFFARYDNYNPQGDLSSIASNANTATFGTTVSQYDPSTKEQFITAGIDYMPFKNVHFMPNIWLNTYNSSLSSTGANDATKPVPYINMNTNVTGVKGTDAVYRLTFYYIFNAKQGSTKF